jgi:hypothetical protein
MFGLMVVAMCALGASFVASASAEAPGKFLVNGAVPAAPVAATTEGELLFESLKTANVTFLCSRISTVLSRPEENYTKSLKS